jgi:chromate transporter
MGSDPGTLAGLARFFLWLGTVGVGGPVVHLALLEEHAVRRRRWLTPAEFVELLGLTNLIPGPNSTEMAMAIGYRRARLPGLVVAGACFILPAALLTSVLAWGYVRYAAVPWLQPALAGLGPAVLVVMGQGAWRLGRDAVTTWADAAIALVVVAAALAGIGEATLLFGAAMVGALLPAAGRSTAALCLLAGVALSAAGAVAAPPPSLADLSAFFLRVGAVLYGGGYVLVAFLQSLVDHQGWLTQRQLLDAVAAGQVTPGPVLTTATFVGFLIHGPAGAAVATLAIFLPAFVFTAALGPLTPWLQRSAALRRAVRVVSVAAVALVAVVTVTLAFRVLRTPAAFVPVAVGAAVALRGWGTAWVLLAGVVASALTAALR